MSSRGDASEVQGPRFGDDWWRRGVIYQIYPRSFADSDGDGLGDLPGIVEHLDHLGPEGLGVDAIWLSPIYPSPGLDLGYDVSDHEHVDPRFGTEEDFDRLVEKAHALGIRVVLDLVMNHTSDQHAWFIDSRSGRDSEHAGWYLWRDPAGFDTNGQPLPPNNWVSYFGGPGWEREPRRDQAYYHTFLAQQPELNWRNPGVEEAQWRMVRGWLGRGVDGFRLDVFNAFLKHPDLPDNPTQPGPTAWTRQVHVNDRDQPDLPALIGRFRAILDERPGRMSVGELFDDGTATAASLAADRHLVLDWELLTAPWTAEAVGAALAIREEAFGPDRWPTVVFSNHDQPRHASRLATSVGADPDAIARSAAVVLLTVRGTPFLYYGEELGMRDVEIPLEESVDTPASLVAPDFTWVDRSPERTPMPWTDGPGAGFTTGRPWLRIGPDAGIRNVAAQAADPGSILSLYRRLLALRAAHPALNGGDQRILPIAGDVLAWTRGVPEELVLVVVNLGRGPVRWVLPGPDVAPAWETLLSTHDRPDGGSTTAGAGFDLRGDEAVVLRAR